MTPLPVLHKKQVGSKNENMVESNIFKYQIPELVPVDLSLVMSTVSQFEILFQERWQTWKVKIYLGIRLSVSCLYILQLLYIMIVRFDGDLELLEIL